MRIIRAVVALIAGFVANEVLIVVVGFLAAVAWPTFLYRNVGPETRPLVHTIWSYLTAALPMFLTGTFVAWLLASVLRIRSRSGVMLFAVGVAISVSTIVIGSALRSAEPLGAALWREVLRLVPLALWEIPVGPWATFLGFAAGLWLASRSRGRAAADRQSRSRAGDIASDDR